MRTVKLSAIIAVCSCALLATGCNQELQDLRIQNNTQRELIASLESKLQVAELELDKLKRQLEAIHGKGDIEVETLEQKIAALEEDIAKKNELIASMQQRLLSGGVALPVERFRRMAAGPLSGFELTDISAIIREVRSIKSNFELQIMKEAARRHDTVYQAIPIIMRENVTELDHIRDLGSGKNGAMSAGAKLLVKNALKAKRNKIINGNSRHQRHNRV